MTPEFPDGADLPPDELSRRELGELLGAAGAALSLAGCIHSPTETILPYAHHPGPITPGLPLFYATSMVLDGYATGLLVRSREGRPIKIEGNPEHPASLGAAGVFEQASILELYDSRRMRGLRRRDQPAGWNDLRRRFGVREGAPERADRGAGLAFLLEPTSSPLRRRLLERIALRFPESSVYAHAPTAGYGSRVAARAALGAALVPQHDFRDALRVLAVGSDFTASGPFHLRHARHFASTRRVSTPRDTMSRLYAVESVPTPTGSLADERLRARPSELALVLAAVAHELGAGSEALEAAADRLSPRQRELAAVAARDLDRHRGRGVVIAGEALDPAAHALAAWLNQRLDNVGSTVWYTEPALHLEGSPAQDLARLAREIDAGAVDTLVIAGGNPVYTAPSDVPFGELLERVEETICLAPYENETSTRCRWAIAAAHYLESWGDARAYDGTVSLVQPLIAPLCGGRTADELLAVFAGEESHDAHAMLRDLWLGGGDDGAGTRGERGGDRFWERALQAGLIEGTTLTRSAPVASLDAAVRLLEERLREREPPGLEIALRSDPTVHDGSFAGNRWLQELPDPVTKLTWGNAVLLSPRTASELAVGNGSMVEVETAGRAVRGPVFVLPGHADGALTLHLGHGRVAPFEPAAAFGFDAYALRPTAAPWVVPGATLRALAAGEMSARERRHHALASTQQHWRLEGRDLVLRQTLEELRARPDLAAAHRGPLPSFYGWEPDPSAAAHARDQWAMTIDLSVCTGCNACVIACQAENNIQVVGKEGVRKGREMHWIRIDRYLTGPPEEPVAVHQPMLCQHCERAPCEYVCPVFATTHSADGLNEMTYNRCVGTRFCSNNCPYKVRRFNWFDYSHGHDDTAALVWNPEVTVRERGVMEKCTYCVQRIRGAQIQARLEGDRPIADGEVVPACAQACPSRAIVFGSLTDPASEVSRSRQNPRLYSVLHELGTEPRTRYLVRLTHPHPELARPDARRPADAESTPR
ncbi:MAG TPA: 4Fe-4S dicluster domain-containing protein [Planctomycetota bacterium]|nr:4Fe-4S dicluster domain-containing protein [Planctomycetota bacterium]